MPRYLTLVLLLLPGLLVGRELRVTSPNGRLTFWFTLTKTAPTYRVTLDNRPVVMPSELSLQFAETGTFGPNLKQGKPRLRTVDETYDLVVGKAKTVRNHCREALIPLTQPDGHQLNLVVRVFNDGVAFRYEFPKQPGWVRYTLTDENTTFRLPPNTGTRALFLPNFTSSHEGLYTTLPLDSIKADTLIDMPALFNVPGNIHVAITEAALVDYAGMYLTRRRGASGPAVLTSQLSPLPGQGARGEKVKAVLPHQTPWRVLLVSDRLGTLIESNILTSLNEPLQLTDVSWVKPGKTTFPWWNGNVTPDTTWAPGNNFDTQKYYIDFCADHHIDYHSVVEYGLHEWYVNDGAGFVPGPNVDAAKAVPGLDMQQVCDYAKQRGVGVRVWVYWTAIYPKLEEVFTQYEKWGLSGMMVDFMDRDDQEMVNIQNEILRVAAKHRLHIQFHGAYKPTGRHRTYPNEFTREGTLNYEVQKWSGLATPDHDISFPFTRLLAGATDMHLGGFRAVPRDRFKVQYTRPLMHGTRCHQLAQYVVLESYLQMVADYPDAYRNQPGFAFIEQVPTTWDETRVLTAEEGQYVAIARRSGPDWFVGTVTNGTARQLDLKLDFLPDGHYTADLYADAPDVATNPNHLMQQMRPVRRGDVLNVDLAAGGGHVMRIRREK